MISMRLKHDMMYVLPGQLTYQAQSPDEGALVSAARNFGYVYKVMQKFESYKHI